MLILLSGAYSEWISLYNKTHSRIEGSTEGGSASLDTANDIMKKLVHNESKYVLDLNCCLDSVQPVD